MSTIASTQALAEAFETRGLVPFIDVDSHVSEPVDLWTTRMSRVREDDVPRVVTDPLTGRLRWKVGDELLYGPGRHAHAGWSEPYPSTPPTLEECDPAAWQPEPRLKKLDDSGIVAQVLYPNILGFNIWAFLKLDPRRAVECVRAYNDYQVDFCSTAPARLIPLVFLPFWDIDASVRELERCVALGFRALNFGSEFERLGLPSLRDEHWHPILSRAQHHEMSVNFHIGFARATEDEAKQLRSLADMNDATELAKTSALFMLGNARCIAELVMTGICHRYPTLEFVSVESGFGYVPFLLEALDWQFQNLGARLRDRERLLPSEYFRRQVYATFWFEAQINRTIDLYPDNAMFETDFPHPTSLSPGPTSTARSPQETITTNLAAVPPDVRRKVLYDTAARVYHVGA